MPSTSRTVRSAALVAVLASGCSAALLLPALPGWAQSPTVTALSPVSAQTVTGVLPTSLGETSSATQVLVGRSVVFTGTLTQAGTPVAGAAVDLVAKTVGSSAFETLAHLTSGSNGAVRAVYAPKRTRVYELRYAGNVTNAASTSPQLTVHLKPTLTMTLAPAGIVRGETTTISGRVGPALSGATVALQLRHGTAWSTIRSAKVGGSGTWSVPLSPALGAYDLRAVLVGAASYDQTISKAAVLRVDQRDLLSGDSGSDVRALQALLVAQHFDPGAVTGLFDRNTLHAVYAFEKLNGLPRLGRWTKVERLHAGHPVSFHLRYPTAGRSVEVDVTKQVLAYAVNGAVVKVVDVSTGSGNVYYQEGVRNVARTPRGRYRINHKIDGIRISKLGELYRPSYFFQGYAVHGEGSVPAYPASHGCVRITNAMADKLFPLLTIGTPVAVYDE